MRLTIILPICLVLAGGIFLMAHSSSKIRAQEPDAATLACADLMGDDADKRQTARTILQMTEETIRSCESDEECALIQIPCLQYTSVNQEFHQCLSQAASLYGSNLDCVRPTEPAPRAVCHDGVCQAVPATP